MSMICLRPLMAKFFYRFTKLLKLCLPLSVHDGVTLAVAPYACELRCEQCEASFAGF